MTQRQREALLLRADGLSYADIGERMYITKESAYQLVYGAISDKVRGYYKRGADICIYPNVAAWMRTNKKTSVDIAAKAGLCRQTVYKFMHGVPVTLRTARAIAKAMDMTVRQATEEAKP